MKQRMILTTAFVLALSTSGVAGCGGAPAQEPHTAEAPPEPPSKPTAAASPADKDISSGTAAITLGDWSMARKSFEAAVEKDPNKPEAHYYLGLTLDKAGERAAAQGEYKKALSLAPSFTEAATNLMAIDIEDRNYDDAIELAKGLLAKDDKNATIQLNLATALSGKGDVPGAGRAFEKAIALAPNDARFYLAFANHLEAAKQPSEAVARLKQAERVAGDDPALLGSIGFALRTARAVPECIAAFDRAIAIKDTADFRTNRALCKYAAKDEPGALADLKAATKAEPSFAPAHYWLGSWLHDEGKFAEAVSEYQAYLKAAPTGLMAKAAESKAKLAKAKKKPEAAAKPRR